MFLWLQVECYSSIEKSLQDKDLVLNCEYPGAWGQLHNAAMASAPGHPFWLQVLQEAFRRSPAGVGWLRSSLQKLWAVTPLYNRINSVLHSTGPMLLTDVYHVSRVMGQRHMLLLAVVGIIMRAGLEVRCC